MDSHDQRSISVFDDVKENGMLLNAVSYYAGPESCRSVELIVLEFLSDTVLYHVCLKANCDTDEIIISQDLPSDMSQFVPIPPPPIWRVLVEHSILFYWKMINNQGYFDGLQIDFRTTVDDPAIPSVQFQIAASSLSTALVVQCPCPTDVLGPENDGADSQTGQK